jgi:hypothetical protein
MSFAVPATNALYYGPKVVVPTAIPPGADISIQISTTGSATFSQPPAGGNNPCTSGTCVWTFQSCADPSKFYVALHKVLVIDPKGNQYSLGSAAGVGIYWPANQGGGMSNSGPPSGTANELNITGSQTDTLSFGTGQTGASGASFASENYFTGAPFTAVADTAGPYYWWTVNGHNTNGGNLRLDQHTSIQPTLTKGTYTIDFEGVAVCGNNVNAFVSQVIFFDAAVVVVTPEFGLSGMLVAGFAFALAMLVKRGSFGRKAIVP